MGKWKLLRYYIAKEATDLEEKYLKTSQTGTKAEEAKIVRRTLHNVWNAMDEIDKMEDNNESSNNDRKLNEKSAENTDKE